MVDFWQGDYRSPTAKGDDFFGTPTHNYQSPTPAQREATRRQGGEAYFGGEKWTNFDGGYQPDSGTTAAAGYRQQAATYGAGRTPVQVDYRGTDPYYARGNTALAYGQQALGKAGTNIDQGEIALQGSFEDRMNASQARDKQLDALAFQRQAATGAAPSRAELLGRGLIDQSMQAQAAGAAGARGGPLAQIMAQRGVQQQAAGFQQQGMNQLSALRADEMERAREQYMRGATGIRGQDYQGQQGAIATGQGYGQLAGGRTNIANAFGSNAGVYGQYAGQKAGQAQFQGQMDFNQRQLDQGNQQFYDQMGWNTLNSQADRQSHALQAQRQADEQHWAKAEDIRAGRRQASNQAVGGLLGGIGSMFGFISDVRAKVPAQVSGQKPLLLDLGGKTPSAAAPNWLDQHMSPQIREREQKAAREEHKERTEDDNVPEWLKAAEAGDPLGGRDDPYSAGTPGGIQREDPYGGGLYNPRTGKEVPGSRPVYFGSTDAPATTPEVNMGPMHNPVTRPTPNAPSMPYGPDPDMAQTRTDGVPAAGGGDQRNRALAGFGAGLQTFGRSLSDNRAKYYSDEDAKRAAFKDGMSFAQKASTSDPDEARRAAFKDGMSYATNAVTSRGVAKAGTVDMFDAKQLPDYMQKPAGPRTTPNMFDASKLPDYMQKPSTPKAPQQQAPAVPASSAPKPGLRSELEGRSPAARGAPVEPPPGDARALQKAREKGEGPFKTSSLLQDANRRQAGFPYAYKDNFRPPEQSPGELNYGFSAQELAKNPITATAVAQSPNGMLAIDPAKLQKVQSASIADLQNQIDDMRGGYRYG